MKSAGVAAVVALVGMGNAWALPDRCTLERTVSASEGSLGHMYIGKQFTVERKTGLMAVKNLYLTEPQVIDCGSSDKVVTTMRKDQGAGAGSSLFALSSSEYKGEARKPFVFLSDYDVYLGWREHFLRLNTLRQTFQSDLHPQPNTVSGPEHEYRPGMIQF